MTGADTVDEASKGSPPGIVLLSEGLGPWCRSVRLFAHHKIVVDTRLIAHYINTTAARRAATDRRATWTTSRTQ